MRSPKHLTSFIAGLVLALPGCGPGDVAGPGSSPELAKGKGGAVATVTIAPASSTIGVGESLQLIATARTSDGTILPGVKFKWSSSDAGVVAVAGTGIVSGVVLGGPVTITARAGKVQGSASVTVGTALSDLQLVISEIREPVLKLFTMRGDGSDRQYIADALGGTWWGNTIIARGAFQDNTIYSMSSTGANRHQILGAGPSYSPSFSPDGQRFALTYGDCGGGQHPLAFANADGSGLVLVGPCGDAPKWSPLGDRLVYWSNGNVHTVNTDGSGVVQVTSTGTAGLASYSPDGARLVYHDVVEGRQRLMVMNADGSGVWQLTFGGVGDDTDPDWSPVGDWVAFTSTRSGAHETWVVRVTPGAAPIQVTFEGGGQHIPRWKRGP